MKFFIILLLAMVATIASGAIVKTDCETHRDRELRPGGNIPVAARLIPKCDSKGNYEPLQCHGAETEKKRACQCWNKNGDILTSPSFKLRACSCIMAKKTAEKDRSTPPTCEADGRFARKQCVKDKCDCVNQDTGKKESC